MMRRVDPVDMIAGTQAAYSVVVSNNGSSDALNVVLTDTLPAGVTFVSSTPVPTSQAGQTLTYNLGTIAASGSTTITINVNVTATSGTLTNSTSATTDSVEGGNGNADNSDSCSSTVKAPDIAVVVDCPVDMIAGTQAAYTVTVSNNGSSTANNVVLTDTLPAGVTFVSASTAPTSTSGQTLTWNLGNIAAGGSTVITINVNVTATTGTLTNSASVTTDSVEGGNGATDNSDDCSSTAKAPDIAVAKTCPVDMIAGTQASYSVTVSNSGSSTANNVILTDMLPAGVTFVSATPAPTSQSGQTLDWNLGNIAAGGSSTVTITVSVGATGGTLTNTAMASTDSVEGGNGNADNNDSCDSTVKAPDVAISKACPADMIAGTGAAYTLTVSNIGSSTANNVVVTDTLPADVAYVSANPAPTSVSGQTLTWNLGNMNAGASTNITISVIVNGTSGTNTNSASATTASVEGGLGQTNNSDDCTSTLKSADIAVDKTCPATMISGTQAVYTILVSNNGTSVANDVELTDTLPAGVTFVSASPAPLSQAGQTLTWDLGNIDAGDSVTVTITVNVTATSGTLTNSASVTTDSAQGGNISADDVDSCSSTVNAPDVDVSKSCPVDMVAGTQAAYSITVSNTGSSTANNVVVTDTLPAQVSFVSATPAPTSQAGATLTWNLGNMAAGASTTITINANVMATSGTATNTASATTDSVEGGQGQANNSDTCSSTVKSADVTITKTCPATATANQAATFTIDFSNSGTSNANAVVVTDDVPAVGTMAPGASGTLTITGTANNSSAARGDYVNDAMITTTSVQSDVTNDTDSCTTKLLAPVLGLAKTSVVTQNSSSITNNASITAGDIVEQTDTSKADSVVTSSTIVYTLTYSNTGDADATGVVITDALPAGTTFVSATGGGTHAAGVVTWNIGTIAAGTNGNVTVTVTTN